MYDNKIFSRGVWGVLKVDWSLICETPLVIRNGLDICYTVSEAVKTRNQGLNFAWKGKVEKTEYEVAALHYGYEVKDGKVGKYHFVPASSVRGALRTWTIRQFVQSDFQGRLTPPKADQSEAIQAYFKSVQAALTSPQTGYPLVAGLFGLALEARQQADLPGNAGRLIVETEPFASPAGRAIAINGPQPGGEMGPANARREMAVRNPLDRVTHASKDGGLHHFLEFCRGETFGVHLSILNPRQADLGLVSLWVREMNTGLLRLGALTSIGRGRVRVQEQGYRLWQAHGRPAWPHFVQETPAPTGEALAGLWECRRLEEPEQALRSFEKDVLTEIGGADARP